jgi:hypothetical protein
MNDEHCIPDLLLRLSEEDRKKTEILLSEIKNTLKSRGVLLNEKGMRLMLKELIVTHHDSDHSLAGNVLPQEIPVLLEELHGSLDEIWAWEDADHEFRSHWNLVAKLFKKPEEIEAFIDMMADLYETDVNDHGRFWARILYRKHVLTSVWPILSWLLHTIEALRRMVG